MFATPAFAKVYLTVEQARSLLFPGSKFQPIEISLTDAQVKAIQDSSGIGVINKKLHVWRVSNGGWFIVDEVVGKHEFIPFAVGLDDHGAVLGIEILEYRESYGSEIRDPMWLKQFVGVKPGTILRDGKNIHNISGATLSSAHLTDGITRLLSTYEIVLKPSGS